MKPNLSPVAPKSPLRWRRPASLLLAVGLVLTVAFLAHVQGWWSSASLVVIGFVVLGHLLFGVGVLLLVPRRDQRGSEEVQHAHGGELIRRPRLYDAVVGLVSLGSEARIRDHWLSLAEVGPGDRVLDVGCGTGTLLRAAAERLGGSGGLWGLEPSPEMLEHARRKATEQNAVIKLERGSADALPYPDGSFDVVLCTLVLHHLPSEVQNEALREMGRVLRPAGRILIVDMKLRSVSLRRWLSLITVLHGGSPRRLVDVPAGLAAVGFEDVEELPGGSNALAAYRARQAPE